MKLTRDPGGMREADVEALRAVGLSDTAIHDVAQVTAMFNYYNRIADGLGIAIDPTTKPQ
jgi:alkylhydroperoxidase family enzyme